MSPRRVARSERPHTLWKNRPAHAIEGMSGGGHGPTTLQRSLHRQANTGAVPVSEVLASAIASSVVASAMASSVVPASVTTSRHSQFCGVVGTARVITLGDNDAERAPVEYPVAPETCRSALRCIPHLFRLGIVILI